MCITCRGGELKVGDNVHRKTIFEGTRVGCKEVHTVKYVSKTSVVVEITSATGTFLAEELLSYPAFMDRYEKCN